ncbi:hypothetical protein EI555_010556 [Monodon monoceros]|uniref:Uncharacterized protein n=1 Tax=Monodon monoceros TaxID=40151 RepID=A0A4U1FHB3_MONMO|nr:hypothetical protein EI555_010556 [Monodon monoceros]
MAVDPPARPGLCARTEPSSRARSSAAFYKPQMGALSTAPGFYFVYIQRQNEVLRNNRSTLASEAGEDESNLCFTESSPYRQARLGVALSEVVPVLRISHEAYQAPRRRTAQGSGGM